MKKVLISLAVVGAAGLGVYQGFFNKKVDVDKSQQEELVTTKKKTMSAVASADFEYKNHTAADVSEKAVKKDLLKKEAKSTKVSPERMQAVNNFVKNSGIEKEFSDMDDLFAKQIESIVDAGDLSEEDRAKLGEVFQSNFYAEELLSQYKERLAQELSEEQLAELEKINNDPITQSLKEDNDMSNLAAAQQQYTEFLANERENPTSAERMNMIKDWESKKGDTKFTVDLTMKMMEELDKNAPKQEGAPQLQQNPEMKKQFFDSMQGMIVDSLKFKVRNLSDEEFAKHVKQTTSEASLVEDRVRKDVTQTVLGKKFAQVSDIVSK